MFGLACMRDFDLSTVQDTEKALESNSVDLVSDEVLMSQHNKLQISLFLLRISVFIVMLVWAIDKFVNPAHAASVWANFYFVKGLQTPLIYIIGAVQMAIYAGFVFGVKKKLCYGLVLLMHAGSTLLAYKIYLMPWASGHLLFFAAWPMLAACYMLYSLRESDTLLSLNIR